MSEKIGNFFKVARVVSGLGDKFLNGTLFFWSFGHSLSNNRYNSSNQSKSLAG